MVKAGFSTIDGSENVFLGWREKKVGLGISSVGHTRAVEEFFSATLRGARILDVGRAG